MSAKCRQQYIRSYDVNSLPWSGWHSPSEELQSTSQAAAGVALVVLEEEQEQKTETKSELRYYPHATTLELLKADDTCYLVNACAKKKDLFGGSRMHAHLLKWGLLEQSSPIANAVICMYVKCGLLEKAKLLLDAFPAAVDLYSWTALITGYVQRGQGQDALECFEWLLHRGLSPDAVTFACVLKACGNVGAIDKGDQIHDEIVRQGLLSNNTILSNALVNMYVKCGALVKARQVLDKLSVRDIISWTVLIDGYAKQGHGQEALNCFDRLEHEGLLPDAATFACILKACGSMRETDKGEQIHIKIAKQGLLQNNMVLGNALLDMYAKCGDFTKAKLVLEEFPTQDVVLWTTLIAGYIQHGQGEEALKCFERMQEEGILPNKVTLACALKACGSLRAMQKGKQIHDEIVRQALLSDLLLANALVEMYANCGDIKKARQVLEELPARDAVSWNALITGYIQQGQAEEALDCYERMLYEGVSPDAITFSCILKACGAIGAVDKGEQMHDEIVRQNLLDTDIVLGNALVDMYARCGALEKARQVLEALPFQDAASWNSLITGYAQRGRGHKALECFEQMQQKGLSPNVVSYACILKAIGSIGRLYKGEDMHVELLRCGLPGSDVLLGVALVDMYAKCGALLRAAQVLEELPAQNAVSWTALIAGYTQQGQGENAVKFFELMRHMGLSPDRVTFSCVLNACSHSGLVNEGQMYLAHMSTKFGIEPDLEHYTCMIDLFGRSGHLDKAVEVIQKLPSSDHSIVLSALLGACQKWQDVKIGRWAFDHAIQVDKSDVAAYILMTNMYVAAGMQEEADKIEALRVANKAGKEPGRSWWVDIRGNVYSTNPIQDERVSAKLEDIADKLRDEGHTLPLNGVSPNTSSGCLNLDVLCGHSVMLALVCALLNTSKGEMVRILNNMSICGRCHSAISLVSRIEKRAIVVRDAYVCHDFEHGKCSCGL